MELIRYEFKCPFCGENEVTFISKDKLEEVRSREKLIQEIFPPHVFSATYREIFVSKICSKCQADTFNNPESLEKPFDVNIDDNKAVENLEARIAEMYENYVE